LGILHSLVCSLPAAPETVALWLTALADGYGTRKPLARSSINQALSAVILRHRDHGCPLERNHKAIAKVWEGICKTKAEKEAVRKAKPLLTDELRDLIECLDLRKASGARDAALLALGWAGALRRSELVSLDWQKLGRWRRLRPRRRPRHRRQADDVEGFSG
jgi:integrase